MDCEWVEIITVDKETLRASTRKYPVPKGSSVSEMLVVLVKLVNVGEFVRLPSGEAYRRVRGGWRELTPEDKDELLTALLFS